MSAHIVHGAQFQIICSSSNFKEISLDDKPQPRPCNVFVYYLHWENLG